MTNSQGLTQQMRMTVKRGCKVCQEQVMGDQCAHCFKCGQSRHFSRGCRGQKRLVVKPDSMKATVQPVPTPSPSTTSQDGGDGKVYEFLCEKIRQLEAESEGSGKTGHIVGATYASHLSLHHQAKLKAVIGKKCLVDCPFEGVATQALWDTGSQVTIINDRWRKSCIPHIQLRNLNKLSSEDETLVGKATN